MISNLTEGTPYKIILRFAFPIFLGNLLQQLYSFTDMAIIGQYIGLDALAGVGGVSSFDFLILGFVLGTTAGFGIPIARSFGAGDIEKIRTYFANALLLTIFCSLIITTVVLVFIDPILSTLNLPANAYPYSKTYIVTYCSGLTGIFIYNLLAAVLRSVGNSKTPLYFLIYSSLLNIILDLIFVLIFNWEVFGTAIATVISQSTAAILCIVLVYRKYDILRLRKTDLKIDLTIIKALCISGFPMGLQFSITAIGTMILQSAVNALGTAYIAAVAAGGRIHAVLLKGFEAIGIALASYSGQNIGAKKIDRIGLGMKHSFYIGAIYSFICFVFLLISARFLAMIFIDSSEVLALDSAYFYLNVSGACYILLQILHIFRNTVQGIGYASVAMFAGVFELIARLLVASLLVTNFGFVGAALANPISWVFADVFLIIAYIKVMKKIRLRMAVNN